MEELIVHYLTQCISVPLSQPSCTACLPMQTVLLDFHTMYWFNHKGYSVHLLAFLMFRSNAIITATN